MVSIPSTPALYFTSAIRPHTSDIFQSYSVCEVTNFISHQPSDFIHPTSFSHISHAKLINYFEIITRTDPVIHQMQVGATKLLLYLCALFYEFDKVIVYLITSNRYQFVSFYDKLNSCIVLVFSISPAKVRKKIEPTK